MYFKKLLIIIMMMTIIIMINIIINYQGKKVFEEEKIANNLNILRGYHLVTLFPLDDANLNSTTETSYLFEN